MYLLFLCYLICKWYFWNLFMQSGPSNGEWSALSMELHIGWVLRENEKYNWTSHFQFKSNSWQHFHKRGKFCQERYFWTCSGSNKLGHEAARARWQVYILTIVFTSVCAFKIDSFLHIAIFYCSFKDSCILGLAPLASFIYLSLIKKNVFYSTCRCIKIRNLRKVYATKKGKCCAVNSLKLTLYENQILALLGECCLCTLFIFTSICFFVTLFACLIPKIQNNHNWMLSFPVCDG